MSRTSNAEESLKHTTWFAYPLLRLIGCWPNSGTSSPLSKISRTCIIVVSYFLQLTVFIPGLLNILLKEKNSRRRLMLLIPQLNGFSQLCRYTFLLRWKDEIGGILDEIKGNLTRATEEDHGIFYAKANIGHRIMLMIAFTMYCGGLGYRTIIPLSKGRIVLPNNATKRLLPCPSYFMILNEQSTPNYEIIFVMQVLGGFFNYSTLCASVGTCTMFCLHVCSMFRILAMKMADLSNQSDVSENAVQRKIADIVEYHSNLVRLFDRIEQTTTYFYFLSVTNEVVSTCMLGYGIITEWKNGNTMIIAIYFTLQTTCIFSTFTQCYIGQLLIDEVYQGGNNVKQKSITLNWYRFPPNKARSWLFVILMSSQPRKVTAGKFVHLSLVTFTDIMKASMGYLNILREVN